MASGPDHYQAAQIAQEAAAAIQANRQPGPEATAVEALLDALVHATLALAAATALKGTGLAGLPHDDYEAWHKAAGVPINDEDES
jgi:hypothetical protein